MVPVIAALGGTITNTSFMALASAPLLTAFFKQKWLIESGVNNDVQRIYTDNTASITVVRTLNLSALLRESVDLASAANMYKQKVANPHLQCYHSGEILLHCHFDNNYGSNMFPEEQQMMGYFVVDLSDCLYRITANGSQSTIEFLSDFTKGQLEILSFYSKTGKVDPSQIQLIKTYFIWHNVDSYISLTSIARIIWHDTTLYYESIRNTKPNYFIGLDRNHVVQMISIMLDSMEIRDENGWITFRDHCQIMVHWYICWRPLMGVFPCVIISFDCM